MKRIRCSITAAAGAHLARGTTTGGRVNTELLPLSYPFRLTYAYASQQKSQNIASATTVTFQTVNVTIELHDSAGNLLGEADSVQYYSGGWHAFGTGTTSGGQAVMELLPLSISIPVGICLLYIATQSEYRRGCARAVPNRPGSRRVHEQFHHAILRWRLAEFYRWDGTAARNVSIPL